MKPTPFANCAAIALLLSSFSGAASAASPPLQGGPPIIDYLEISTLTRHQRVSIHGVNLEQTGQVHIAGIPAFVVPIPGTNAVKMNAYVPADAPFGFCDVTVTTSGGVSNPLTLDVVPRAPEGRKLWRFFMNNQIMLHRPALGADGTIYAKSQAGDLIAITPDGEMKWFLQFGSDLTPEVSVGHDGTIYTADGGPTIHAVNPDGTLKWSYSDPIPNQGVIAGPNVGPDGNLYVVTHEPGTGAFSLDPNGNRRWTGPDSPYSPIGQRGQEIVFSPTQLFFCQQGYFDSFDYGGNHLFRQNTLTFFTDSSPQPAVGPNGDSYIERLAQLESYDPSGNLNWSTFGVGGTYMGQPDIGPDGTIYVMRNVFNTFHAVNPDGSDKWTYNHPETLLDPVIDPAGETILIGGGGSGTSFYLALDKDGNPLWQFDLPLEVLGPFDTVLAFPQGRPRFTPDGSVAYVMASSTSNSGGHCYVYALQMGPSVSVGHGLAGTSGLPSLETEGTLEPGTPLTVKLSSALPNAPIYLVIGSEADAAPFKQGVLLPSTDVVVPLTSGAAGELEFSFKWPQSFPPETTIYLQYWITDPAAPEGLAASNALSLITP